MQVDMDELRKQVVHNNSSVSKDQFLQREGVNVKTSYGVKKE